MRTKRLRETSRTCSNARCGCRPLAYTQAGFYAGFCRARDCFLCTKNLVPFPIILKACWDRQVKGLGYQMAHRIAGKRGAGFFGDGIGHLENPARLAFLKNQEALLLAAAVEEAVLEDAEAFFPRDELSEEEGAWVSREIVRPGVTSDFPTKVAPSSMMILVARRSPVNWELALSSQRSVTEMFPSTVP